MERTCLIVDDSRVVRKIARKIVEDLGFACIEAEDGSRAREICLQSMPDAIVLDWLMPTMTGIDFLKSLRSLPGGMEPKVIFCTTENDVKHMRDAIAAGADEYIMKPFDGEIISNKFEIAGLI